MNKNSQKILCAFVLFVTMLTAVLAFSGVMTKDDAVTEAVVLKQGSTGNQVKTVQTKLKRWGYYTGAVDGIYGAATTKAVKYFQKQKRVDRRWYRRQKNRRRNGNQSVYRQRDGLVKRILVVGRIPSCKMRVRRSARRTLRRTSRGRGSRVEPREKRVFPQHYRRRDLSAVGVYRSQRRTNQSFAQRHRNQSRKGRPERLGSHKRLSVLLQSVNRHVKVDMVQNGDAFHRQAQLCQMRCV